jgi:hypothetical protein
MTSGLKNSNRQNKFPNENITIDAKHSEMINHFKNLKDSIPSLKDELKKLVSSYNNKDPSRKNDIDYILYRNEIRDKINEIKSKIQSISSNNDMNKYYLDVGVLLHNYYENIENSKTEDLKPDDFEDNLVNFDNDEDSICDEDDDIEKCENKDLIQNKPSNNVLNFFNSPIEKNTNDNEPILNKDFENMVDNEASKNEGVYTSTKISDFVKHESTFKKKNILDEYLQKIDINYISRIKIDKDICNCPNCKIEMVLYPSDGLQICQKCGLQQNILIESDKPSFKDPPLEICYFSYKRINHFNEYKRQNIYQRIGNICNSLINYISFLIN